MKSQADLSALLFALDSRGYKAYKQIKGEYSFPDFTLIIDYVQGDPFAAPTQCSVIVPQAIAQFPPALYNSLSREIALRDYLTRQFYQVAKDFSGFRGTGKSGLIQGVEPAQEILERTAVFIDDQDLEVRFWVGLPAKGRSILGRQAEEMLCYDLPQIVQKSLLFQNLNAAALKTHVETSEDADWIRSELAKRGLVAFIANGAILPRQSGVDAHPLTENVIPFQSPPELTVSFDCPNHGSITGMGIKQGITLIVGGGYHGKSTLLKGIELGVYNHLPGDGREWVITDANAVKIRAEDGRSIASVDISPFINQLPQGQSTQTFSSNNASGSTSQATNIIEALEVGATTLLLDEDTSATNFMIRDRRMQQLIHKDKEPITPFVDKVRQLYQDYGVSAILVMGGSGDYFDVADTVIAMDNFQPQDVTATAKHIAASHKTERLLEGGAQFGTITPRIPAAESIDASRGKRAVTIKVRDTSRLGFGTEDIDLSAVEQLVETTQLRAIALGILYGRDQYGQDNLTLTEMLNRVLGDIEAEGLDILSEYPQADLSYFRKFELVAALNRLRSLAIVPQVTT
ncbi:ABC-ATPase domain-containing protein [Picosynechococcus sp. PCC 7117]|uniref:ABC-ATPase domain-containing protein n=1 Tax=Picosynechococcus sp. PCC 7117 TaxID=195498 RepID=UPI000810A313|nr:ABC-ATPase domain-containing protein [Picosynechococcus sp. PCC 7117]ANV88406.1 ATPase [Picosynechococcus sp. PCC 7117]